MSEYHWYDNPGLVPAIAAAIESSAPPGDVNAALTALGDSYQTLNTAVTNLDGSYQALATEVGQLQSQQQGGGLTPAGTETLTLWLGTNSHPLTDGEGFQPAQGDWSILHQDGSDLSVDSGGNIQSAAGGTYQATLAAVFGWSGPDFNPSPAAALIGFNAGLSLSATVPLLLIPAFGFYAAAVLTSPVVVVPAQGEAVQNLNVYAPGFTAGSLTCGLRLYVTNV